MEKSSLKLLPFKRVRRVLDVDEKTNFPPSKRLYTENTKKTSNREPLIKSELGDSYYLIAQDFNGSMLIHLRYYKRRDDKEFPTKLGIALDLEKWKKIVDCNIEEIDENVEKMQSGQEVFWKKHLGENVYISMDSGYPCVNIRKWSMPEGEHEIRATRKGCALNFSQWQKLKDCVTVVQNKLGKELEDVQFCELSDDHQNQMGFYTCKRCNPNEWMNYV
jgi:hypothetical protein